MREDGNAIFSSQEADKNQTYATVQCRHCGRHWIMVPGSGKKRGWCMRCNGPTCGNSACEECIPAEKKLEIAEGSVNPTAVTVSRGGIIIPGVF